MNLERDHQLSEVLSEFARTLVSDYPIQGILDHLVQRIVDVLPITAAGVTLIDGDLAPKYIAASNDHALRSEELQTRLGEGPCLAAYELGDAVIIPDLRQDTRFPRFCPEVLKAGVQAVFAFPLRQGSAGAIGALDLFRDTPGTLSMEAMRAAQTLADVAAAYIANAEVRAELRASSLHDPLTGLPNRTLLADRLAVLGARSGRYDFAFAVMFCDLDKFKGVNDDHGHLAGDQVLIEVGRRLQSIMRPTDTVARLSGDEFVIVCESQMDAEGTRSAALLIAKRLVAAVAEPITIDRGELRLGVSIGVAIFEGPTTLDEALYASDSAMYRAKAENSIIIT